MSSLIGGGIIGVSTALELAERGLSVALCEKGGHRRRAVQPQLGLGAHITARSARGAADGRGAASSGETSTSASRPIPATAAPASSSPAPATRNYAVPRAPAPRPRPLSAGIAHVQSPPNSRRCFPDSRNWTSKARSTRPTTVAPSRRRPLRRLRKPRAARVPPCYRMRGARHRDVAGKVPASLPSAGRSPATPWFWRRRLVEPVHRQSTV